MIYRVQNSESNSYFLTPKQSQISIEVFKATTHHETPLQDDQHPAPLLQRRVNPIISSWRAKHRCHSLEQEGIMNHDR